MNAAASQKAYRAQLAQNPQSIQSLKDRAKERLTALQPQKTVEQPLYCWANLAGLANQSTGILQAGTTLDFFSLSVNSPARAYGFGDVPVHTGICNFTGTSGLMASDQQFVATHFGIQIGSTMPIHVANELLAHKVTLSQRLNDTNSWDMGTLADWPLGVFGPQSRALAADGFTAASNTALHYVQNGVVPARRFSPEMEMFFNPNDRLSIRLHVQESINLTTDGDPKNENNEILDFVGVRCWMWGMKSELVKA